MLVALALVAADGRSTERRAAQVAGGLALAGFALSLALVAVGFDDLITRNVIALWLPAALVVAAGLSVAAAPAAGGDGGGDAVRDRGRPPRSE